MESVEWGGHWMVLIGYDDMGTDDIMLDDILVFADSYDTSDQCQDGYYTMSFRPFHVSCIKLLFYFSLSRIESPMVPSGIFTPKSSAMVAPMIAKVSVSGSSPLSLHALEYARNGTFSRV